MRLASVVTRASGGMPAVDVSHIETFDVETRFTAGEWRNDLSDMIKLQTDDDATGQLLIFTMPDEEQPYRQKMEIASEYYDFYKQCYLIEPTLSWAGLAKVVGAQAMAGVSDIEYFVNAEAYGGILVPGWLDGLAAAEAAKIQQALFEGGYFIFLDIGWQHHAFIRSGYSGLNWTYQNDPQSETALDTTIDGWELLDRAIRTGDNSLAVLASEIIADYEQNTVIVPAYDEINQIAAGSADNVLSFFAVNPTPEGKNFAELFPYPKTMGNTEDRWEWIILDTEDGILDAWRDLDDETKRERVKMDFQSQAKTYSKAAKYTVGILDPLVWNQEDKPTGLDQ